MKTMASVWFLVIMLVGVQKVFGSVCSDNPRTCDECIRCGGNWCNQPGNAKCSMSAENSGCPDHQERVLNIPSVSKAGKQISTIYAERSVLIGETSSVKLRYTSKTPLTVFIKNMNSTKSQDIIVTEEFGDVKCRDMNCTTVIQAKPLTTFCSNFMTNKEFVYVQVSIGDLDQPVMIRYHIACACECSQQVVKKSSDCSGHGDFLCGICTCEPGWKGNRCDQEDCPERGDALSCKRSADDLLDCSGNGQCGHCNTCTCNMTLEGSQYFDSTFCTDLCMDIDECFDCTECLFNSTSSDCQNVPLPSNRNNMNIVSKNESLLEEIDEYSRKKKWVKCNTTVADCTISYMAKREDDDEIYVMVVESCNNIIAGAYAPAPTVSIVLGVLGFVAAVVAVAGIMIYKHMNNIPPVPMSGAGYTDIDAEDCVGENPLYKPPTSSFKNPTYGKW